MRNFTVISLLAIAAGPALAQDPVEWTIASVKNVKSAQAGSVIPIKVTAKLEGGWHIYSIDQGPGGPVPTKISLPDTQQFKIAGKIQSSAPETKFDENFGIDVQYHENVASFTIPIQVAKNATAGSSDLLVNARYQVCNASMCLPARTEKLKMALNIKNGKPVAKL